MLKELFRSALVDASGDLDEAVLNAVIVTVTTNFGLNKLAHFRDEDVTTAQREELQFCGDWLDHVTEWAKSHVAAPTAPPAA